MASTGLEGVAAKLAAESFPVFVAVWFMLRTNGKFDRLTKALNTLTRATVLAARKNGSIDEATCQEMLAQVEAAH